ncbi:hypothetical protein MBLNU457_4208t2 [Dothideomycetes sp. NU457]
MLCNVRSTVMIIFAALLITTLSMFVLHDTTAAITTSNLQSYVTRVSSVNDDLDTVAKEAFDFDVPSVAQILRSTPHAIVQGQETYDDAEDVRPGGTQDAQSVLQ